MTDDDFTSFQRDVELVWRMATSSWSALMITSGQLDRQSLAMMTLQMYHYVKHTVAVAQYALEKVPEGSYHDELRSLLAFVAEEEAGHDRIALEDLERLGYDAEACRNTLPLPTTLNLQGANRLAVDEYGPYYLLGETYATETTGAQISARIHDSYATHPELSAGVDFYDVHGEADVDHAERSEACLRSYLPEQRRPITLGCITAWRNLMALGDEIANFKLYPEPFQLVAKR